MEFKIDAETDKITCKPEYNECVHKDVVSSIILGQSYSGKTTLCVNLILKCLLGKYKINQIYIVSRTVLYNHETKNNPWVPILKRMEKHDEELLETNLFANMNDYIDQAKQWEIEALQDPDNKTSKLVIIDDFIGNKELQSHNSWLSSFVPVSRNIGIHHIFIVQKYNALSTNIKGQSDVVYCGFCSSNLETFLKDFTCNYPSKCLKKLYQYVHDDRANFNFLICRKYKSIQDGYFMKNWNEILDPAQFL